MNSLTAALAKKRILLAAHRGISAGNIPCNTVEAYEAAIAFGADIVELDVSISKDGKLYCFHPGMERPHLGSEKLIADMTGDEVEKLRYRNFDDVPTTYPVSTFYDVMARLKGRCFINVDKFWTAMPEISAVIRRLGMEEQVIVKTSPEEKYFAELERVAPDFMYMPIVSDTDTVSEKLLKRKITLAGAEVLFDSEEKAVAGKKYLDFMHENGLAVWVNPIVYDYRAVISAHHTDDVAIAGDPDTGWGWLAERGFDILQTDWLTPADVYLTRKGYRHA